MRTVLNPHAPTPPPHEQAVWYFDEDKLKDALIAHYTRPRQPQQNPLVEVLHFLHSDAAKKLRVQRSAS